MTTVILQLKNYQFPVCNFQHLIDKENRLFSKPIQKSLLRRLDQRVSQISSLSRLDVVVVECRRFLPQHRVKRRDQNVVQRLLEGSDDQVDLAQVADALFDA